MSQITQQAAITGGRILIDDVVNGKSVIFYSPLIGAQDGVNTLFQIPQSRLVGPSVIIYKNLVPLINGADFVVTDPMNGLVMFTVAPEPTDQIATSFNFTFMSDIEMDGHLFCGSQECGYSAYYTSFSNIPGTEAPTTLPSDIPDALINAMGHIGGGHAADALVMRYAVKYDTEAGDQTFSPSSIAEAYDKVADRLHKSGLSARDDFYKGQPQGSQYRPAMGQKGFVLPVYTPYR